MSNKEKVTLYLATIGFIAILLVAYALDRYVKREDALLPTKEYVEQIKMLNDTIQGLKKDIEAYKVEIERLDFERNSIKKELSKILQDEKKTDSTLVTNNLDYNIRFLTDFLSKKRGD